MILSIAIAQTQMEQASRPSITAFTIQCACQNRAISETSADGSGKADCARSAGFISDPLNAGVPNPLGANGLGCDGCRFRGRTKGAAMSASARAVVSHGRPSKSQSLLPLPTCQNEGYRRVLTSLTRR